MKTITLPLCIIGLFILEHGFTLYGMQATGYRRTNPKPRQQDDNDCKCVSWLPCGFVWHNTNQKKLTPRQALRKDLEQTGACCICGIFYDFIYADCNNLPMFPLNQALSFPTKTCCTAFSVLAIVNQSLKLYDSQNEKQREKIHVRYGIEKCPK